MADKKIITITDALEIVANHLNDFFYLHDTNEEAVNETERVRGAFIGTVVSYEGSNEVEFACTKESWDFAINYLMAYVELKKLVDKGFINYSDTKDQFGFQRFELSAASVSRLKARKHDAELLRKAKMREMLEAEVQEIFEQAIYAEQKDGEQNR